MTDTDAARADRLRAALAWADRLAQDSDDALARYEDGVDRLAGLVAPMVGRTQVRGKRRRGPPSRRAHAYALALSPLLLFQALRAARDEVRSSLATAERALHHLDAPRRLEAVVLAGPEADLASFVDALGRLDETVDFLRAHSGLAAADAARESAAALRADGGALALRNFETLLRLHSGRQAGGAGEGEGRPGERVRETGGEGGAALAPPPVEHDANRNAHFFESAPPGPTPSNRCRTACWRAGGGGGSPYRSFSLRRRRPARRGRRAAARAGRRPAAHGRHGLRQGEKVMEERAWGLIFRGQGGGGPRGGAVWRPGGASTVRAPPPSSLRPTSTFAPPPCTTCSPMTQSPPRQPTAADGAGTGAPAAG